MASLRELKTVWQIRYKDRSRSPVEITDSVPKDEYSEEEARKEAEFRQQLYDRGQYDPWVQDEPGAAVRPDTHLTILQAARTYADARRDAGKRGERGGWTAKTYKPEKNLLEQFARHVGAQRLVEHVQIEHIRSFVYRDELAEATKRGYWRRLQAAFNGMVKMGLLSEAPDMPPEPRARRKLRTTLTPEQLEHIIRAYHALNKKKLENPRTSTAGIDVAPDAWRVAFWQGLRRSELMNMRVRHVDFDEGMLRIGDPQYTSKGKDEALIPLVGDAPEILRPYIEGRTSDAFVWDMSPTNSRLSKHFRDAVDFATDPEREQDKRCKRLDVDPKEVDFYTLRHSCATYWLKNGKSLVWVQRFLRHKDITTTMNYVHLVPHDLLEM
jgi:integrase